MRQETDEDVKSNVSKQGIKRGRPRTRASIKQETEDTKESLKCALYSPVKIEAPSLEISEYESSVKNKHCSICNITFRFVRTFLDHELHSHKTKEIPIINLKNLCCNVCNKVFGTTTPYRRHMAEQNNIRVPPIKPKPNPRKTPDANDPNNYCLSCNFIFKKRDSYRRHSINIHHISPLRPSRNPKNMKPAIDILSLYCDACRKSYDTKKSYIQHLVKLHGIILPKTYSELSNFDAKSLYCKFISHLRRIYHTTLPSCPDLIPSINAKNNYCISCDMTLANRSVYLRHLIYIHLEEKPELYQGIDCNSPIYIIHLDKIHGIKPLNYLPIADDPDVNNPNHLCILCDKTFQIKKEYRRHMLNVHNMLISFRRPIINSNTTPVVMDFLKKYCNVCDRVYKSLQSYRNHLSRYHHVKSGRTKSLSTRVNYNEKPVIDEINCVCPACDKKYATRETYKRHLYSIHSITLPKPNHKAPKNNRDIIPDMNYKNGHCTSCNRTYSDKSVYKRHLAEIHGMKKNIYIKQEDTNEKLNIRSVQTN
ncbi:hypothetical protein EDC94DRAFT_645248 [Helicostylum pulchrum]|nr:hypothetical protein EDC94DRAFT_645248 [Helicostylum pulchrum]